MDYQEAEGWQSKQRNPLTQLRQCKRFPHLSWAVQFPFLDNEEGLEQQAGTTVPMPAHLHWAWTSFLSQPRAYNSSQKALTTLWVPQSICSIPK